MLRTLIFLFGAFSYLLFFGSFLYMVGFLNNMFVPTSVDVGDQVDTTWAIIINVSLLVIFGIQHSVMARPAFKKWWTQVIPEPMERPMYVFLSSILFIVLFLFWKPLPQVIWSVENSVGTSLIVGLHWMGWGILFLSTWLIDHFDLFGLRQVFTHSKGRAYKTPEFQARFFYKYIRHPIMLGWMIAFWATPTMTFGHLLFSGIWTLYILIAIQVEEKDLALEHGQKYREYKKQVPMLIPFVGKGKTSGASPEVESA